MADTQFLTLYARHQGPVKSSGISCRRFALNAHRSYRSRARWARSDGEWQRLLLHLACVRTAIPMVDLVRLMSTRALRRGGVFRIQWSDLDRKKKLVLVRDRKDPRAKRGEHTQLTALELVARSADLDARHLGDLFRCAARSVTLQQCSLTRYFIQQALGGIMGGTFSGGCLAVWWAANRLIRRSVAIDDYDIFRTLNCAANAILIVHAVAELPQSIAESHR